MSLLAGQVHYLSATTPLKNGKPPWCCPRHAEVWRLCCTSWCAAYRNSECTEVRKERASKKLVRLPGVAPGHPPWRGDILLLNHSRGKVKGPGASCFTLPARAISTKNKHLLLSGLRYQPTVSRWLFRCLGAHLLRSPQIVKSGLNHPARIVGDQPSSGPAENLGSPAPFYVF